MGALHYLALDGTSPSLAACLPSCGGDASPDAVFTAIQEVLSAHPARIVELMRTTPQTNEVARSLLLLAGVLTVAARTGLPVRLFDVGASAALNLRLDHYRFEGDHWSRGPVNSPVVLRNTIRAGVPPHLDARLSIVERRACDLHPVDVNDEASCIRLLSYVWADRPDRVARLRSALRVARAVPVSVDTADMLEWVPAIFTPQEGVATIVMHSIVAEHLPPAVRTTFEQCVRKSLAAARRGAPMAWLRMEGEKGQYETRVTLAPSSEEIFIARSDGHAQAIEWAA